MVVWTHPIPKVGEEAAKGTSTSPAPTGAPVKLTLAEAVALGLRDNRAIRSAYLSRIAQKFDLVVAESRFQPKLVLSAGINRDRGGGDVVTTSTLAPTATWLTPTGAALRFSWARTETRDKTGRVRNETANAAISQPLLRGAGIAVNMAPVRIARLQEQINRLQLKSSVSDTVTAIIVAYRSLAQAQQQVRLAQASLERTQDLLATNRALIDAGRMAAADIVQTESGVANQQVAVLQAEQQRNSAQLALLRLLAVDLRTDVVAADDMTAPRVDIDLDKVIALGLDGRMDVLAQRKSVEQSRLGLLQARNNRLWDLSLTAGVSRRSLSTGQPAGGPDPGSASTVGVQLNIPIGDYSLRQGEIQADIGLRQAELQFDDLKQSAEAQIRDAVQSVDAAWRQLDAAKRARDLSARALDLQREKLKAGRASNFEVLSFQSDLRAADTQALSATIAYLNALTTLDQQLGTTLDTWRIDLND